MKLYRAANDDKGTMTVATAKLTFREIVNVSQTLIPEFSEIPQNAMDLTNEPLALWDAADLNRRTTLGRQQHDVATVVSCVRSRGLGLEALQALCRLAEVDYRDTQARLAAINWAELSTEAQQLFCWSLFSVDTVASPRREGETELEWFSRTYEIPAEFADAPTLWLQKQGFCCIANHGGSSGWKILDDQVVYVDYFGGVFARETMAT